MLPPVGAVRLPGLGDRRRRDEKDSGTGAGAGGAGEGDTFYV